MCCALQRRTGAATGLTINHALKLSAYALLADLGPKSIADLQLGSTVITTLVTS